MSWHWQYVENGTLETKIVLADNETQATAVSIKFERHEELSESSDRVIAQIRPRRHPSRIDVWSIKGTWSTLKGSELTGGKVFSQYPGLKPEDQDFLISLAELFQYSINPLYSNGSVNFEYVPYRRLMDYSPKPKK